MKTILPLILFVFLFSCQTEKAEKPKALEEINKKLVYEIEIIRGLSFPEWIAGVWRNIAESNTNRFLTYAFNDQKLTIRQGLNFQGEEKFIESYQDFRLSESQTDSSYLISFKKDKKSVEFKFKLETVEYSDEKVLTYSIIENGKVKRDHLKSIQLVLSKIEPAPKDN
jgi:hypothetical protein